MKVTPISASTAPLLQSLPVASYSAGPAPPDAAFIDTELQFEI